METVKITTWNLCGWNVKKYDRADMVATVVKARPSDVYCFQEVGKDWDLNTVKEDIMAGYAQVERSAELSSDASRTDVTDYLSNHIYYNASTLTLVDSGSKILVKEATEAWLEKSNKTVYSTRDRLMTWAVFEHKETGNQFMVLNAHLDAQHEAFRNMAVKTLFNYIDSDLSHYKNLSKLLCGDMNADYQIGKDSNKPGGYYKTTESTVKMLNDGTHFKWAKEFDGVKFITENKPNFHWYSGEPYTFIGNAYKKDYPNDGTAEDVSDNMDKRIYDFMLISLNADFTPKTYEIIYHNLSTVKDHWKYASDHMPVACELEFNS